MAYKLSSERINKISLVYQSADRGEIKWWELYQELSSTLNSAIQSGEVSAADLHDVESAVLWLDGAVKVNKGEGVFSEFIRQYTVRQFQLRFGEGAESSVRDAMQSVSDEIARKVVFGDILSNGGLIPTMKELADSDASIAGRMLYASKLGVNDSAVSANSGWSGAVLFSMFGTDESGRLVSGGDASRLDTLSDLRDVLFAMDSFRYATKETNLWDVHYFADFFIASRAFRARGQEASFYHDAMNGLPESPDLWEILLGGLMHGEQAEKAISAVHSYGGIEAVFEGLQRGYSGTFQQSQGFQRASEFFSGLGTEKLNTVEILWLSDIGGADSLVRQAAENTENGLAIRNALKFFSPVVLKGGVDFSVRGLEFYDKDSGQGYLTQEWLEDRAHMLLSLIETWKSPDAQVVNSQFRDGFHYQDFASGIDLVTLPDPRDVFIPDKVNRIFFGGDGAEILQGDSGSDRLYGGGGSDKLYGGSGRDFLQGDAGSDVLKGDEGADTLIGGAGSDELYGGEGDDLLIGGHGDDSYFFEKDGGMDVVEDEIGNNKLYIFAGQVSSLKMVGDSRDEFTDAEGNAYHRSGNGDLLIQVKRGGNITVRNFFTSPTGFENRFGISISERVKNTAQPPAVGAGAHVVDKGVLGTAYYIDRSDGSIDAVDYYMKGTYQGRIDSQSDLDDLGNSLSQAHLNSQAIIYDGSQYPVGTFEGGDKADKLLGMDSSQFGETLNGKGGDDFIDGRAGSDRLFGEDGSDHIIGGAGGDTILAEKADSNDAGGSGQDFVDAGDGVDRVSGGGGDDEIHGGAEGDGLTGGSGKDIIFGDDGDDVILGDGYFKADTDSTTALDFSIRLQADFSAAKDTYNDMLVGGDGNDWINGEAGSDTLIGGDGDDRLVGDRETRERYAQYHAYYVMDYAELPVALNGDDLLIGGKGSDYAIGGGGNDVIFGGEGRDYLFGDSEDRGDTVLTGNDSLYGDDGDDQLVGGGGDDYLDGGSGVDLIMGDIGNDTLDGGSGDDELQGGEGNDYLIGGDGIDKLFGMQGNDTIDGGAGNDSIFAAEGDDYVRGGDGNDSIVGIVGNDTLYGDGGDDTLFGEAGSDELHGGDGSDWVQDWFDSTSDDRNILYGDGGNDTVLSYIGQDTLSGGAGNDHVQSGAGNDMLFGDSGDDDLLAQEGNDILVGGRGEDYMFGGAGDDTYRFESGDGFDYVSDNSGALTLVFGAGINAASLLIQQSPHTTYINYGADRISMPNSSFLRISKVSFAGGGTLELSDLLTKVDLSKRKSAETITQVMLNGTLGGNTLDTFAWFGGQLLGIDKTMAGINLNDPSTWVKAGAVSLSGPMLYYKDAAGNILSPVMDAYGNAQVPAGAVTEHVVWPDGSVSSKAANAVTENSVVTDPGAPKATPVGAAGDTSGRNDNDQVLQGTTSSDTLSGGAGNDLLKGLDGDDSLSGGSDDDLVFGGAGNDTLQGDAGVDLLDGGQGNDLLDGGSENDTLNGKQGDDRILGGSGNDLLIGDSGNDTLIGGSGADTYAFSKGDGTDLIDNSDSDGSLDTIEFQEEIFPEDVLARRQGNDLVLSIRNTQDSVRVQGYFEADALTSRALDRITFLSSKARWGVEDIKRMVLIGTGDSDELIGYDASADKLEGLAGNDLLKGAAGDDTLSGGLGNDDLNGGAGNDTYLFKRGDGQDRITDGIFEGNVLRLEGDITREQLSARRSGHDLVLKISGGNDQITVADFFLTDFAPLNRVFFTDGSVLDSDDLKAMTLIGTEGDDNLVGYLSDDFIRGDQGNDTLSGMRGKDTYAFAVGDGHDIIRNDDEASDRQDVIRFGEGVTADSIKVARVGQDLLLTYGSDDSVTVQGFFLAQGKSSMSIDQVAFFNGVIWSRQDLLAKVLIGGVGDERIDGYDSADTLGGGQGNDMLVGGKGDDTYLYGVGHGSDVIDDAEGNDRLVLDGLTLDQLTLRREGDDLLITINASGEVIRVQKHFDPLSSGAGSGGVESIQFAGGNVLDALAIARQAVAGTAGADVIHGHPDGLAIEAGAGADTVHGQAGNDEIHGQEDGDTLFGNDGNDTLFGDGGNDLLQGGGDADILHGGDGNDTLDSGWGDDRLFGDAGDDSLIGQGVLDGGAGNDTLEGSGELLGGDGDDSLKGTGFDTLIGGAGNDVIEAYSDAWNQGDNILEGGAGNDTLYGSFGEDTYRFNLGDGRDLLIERRSNQAYTNVQSAPDTLSFGEGIAATDLAFKRKGLDLIIEHANGSDSITVQNWFKEPTDHFKLERLTFEDGSELSLAEVEHRVVYEGTASADSFIGYRTLDDTMRLGAGDDKSRVTTIWTVRKAMTACSVVRATIN